MSLLSGKWELKPQWNAVSRLLEWPKSKNVSRMRTRQAPLVEMKSVVTTLENCSAVPYNVKHTSTLWSCHITLTREKWKRTHKKTCPRIFILHLILAKRPRSTTHKNLYSSFIHNRSKLETAQMPINRRRDTHILVHLYSGIHLDSKSRQIIYTCNIMDGY